MNHSFSPKQNEYYIEKLLFILKPCLESYVHEDPLKNSNIYDRFKETHPEYFPNNNKKITP